MVERNIAPYVTVEIEQNGVKAGDAVKQLGDIVVRFDLGGVGVPLDPQRGDKAFAEGVPVDLWVGGQMGVIVADGAVDFAQDLNLRQLTELALQTVGDVGKLLADGRGVAGWPWVRAISGISR